MVWAHPMEQMLVPVLVLAHLLVRRQALMQELVLAHLRVQEKELGQLQTGAWIQCQMDFA